MAEKKTTKTESAPKKEHTLTAAAPSGKKPSAAAAAAKPAAPLEGKEGAPKYRIGAIVLWVAAIAFELIAILLLFGKLNWTFLPTLTIIIIALVLDLICIIIGSQLWKKANRLDPASEKNKVKFWLWNNMGLIVCAFAFIPFIIIALTNKNADKKTKTIAAIVAAIALLVGGLCSYDWNPVSLEEKEQEVSEYSGVKVYWTNFGKVYHFNEECSHLNNSDGLTWGGVEHAIESNRVRACKDCQAKYDADPSYATMLTAEELAILQDQFGDIIGEKGDQNENDADKNDENADENNENGAENGAENVDENGADADNG